MPAWILQVYWGRLKKRRVTLEYDTIVVGSSLEAVAYAFNNDLPVFFTRPERPFRFDYLEPTLDLSCLKIESQEKSLKTFGEDKKVGTPKELLWERLLFLLSLRGNAPLSNFCTSMRWDGNLLTCSSDYNRILNISFNVCYFFGDDGCQKFVDYKKSEDNFLVYDWIAFNSGGKHDVDFMETEDSFVSKIWFYPSDRIDGNTAIKDACTISRLSEEQILSFDYSETMARFKTIFEMEKHGMKGLLASYSPNGNPKHYKFKTSTIGRQKVVAERPQWRETDRIKRPPEGLEKILSGLKAGTIPYRNIIENL